MNGESGNNLKRLAENASNATTTLTPQQQVHLRRAKDAVTHETTNLVITHTKDWWSFFSEVLLIGGSLAALGYMFSQLVKQAPDGEGHLGRKKIAERVKAEIIKRIEASGRKIQMFGTSTYEDSLLDMIVLPNQIEVQFNDIGGLDQVKSDLMETVLVPLMHPDLTSTSRLCAPPLGVLFYGAPGTGKSMMAKAVARETNATFFNVDMSRLMSKWYGDSQKYISALFSLAKKMAPSIIWMDEIDALFSQRSQSDHQADVYNKALFLSLWDGLASSSTTTSDDIMSSQVDEDDGYGYEASNYGSRKGNQGSQVIILGATNRPHEVDEAFLRRMGRQYEFEMPDQKTRKLILYILLQYERYDATVDLDKLAEITDEYSGSDLKELCKYAATLPLREYVRNNNVQEELPSQQQEESKSNDETTNFNNDSIGEAEPTASLSRSDINSNNNNNNNNNNRDDLDNSNNSTFWKSLYTLTPGLGNLSSTSPENSTQRAQRLRRNSGRAIDRYSDRIRDGKVELRPINMKDFDKALRHIKSTLKAHKQHENNFGNGKAMSSFLNTWGVASDLANLNIPGLNIHNTVPTTRKQNNENSSKNAKSSSSLSSSKINKDTNNDDTNALGLD